MTNNEDALPVETQLRTDGDLYGPEYYALRLSSIPYERSWHWQHFFSIIAQETVRGLRPRRVLDAGCAMGFLVEQFWDRGVHCDGIDVSEYAISRVRPDIRPFCKVGSLTNPIPGKYDLITCIEVLEHLPAENYSYRRGEFVRGHQRNSVFIHARRIRRTHSLQRAAAHLLAATVCRFRLSGPMRVSMPAISLLMRCCFAKARRPRTTCSALYSEYVRHKMFFEAKVVENRRFEGQLKGLRGHYDQSVTDRLASEQSLRASQLEQDRLLHELDRVVNDRNVLAERLHHSQTALNAALNSRAWRWAEKVRVPMKQFGQDWPVLYRTARSLARRLTGRSNQLPAVALQEQANAPAPPEPTEYQRWISEFEPTSDDLQAQKQAAELLNGPLISIVLPVHRTDPGMLRACVESVTAQTYSGWQLCAAITPDKNAENRKYLQGLAKTDPRFIVIELPENGGISKNTNAALAQATGEFVAFLDHDDTLAPFALYEVALRVQSEPEADLLYSDHDYFDVSTGERCRPLFKPDWSPSIMFSANYITHLTVLRRALLDQIGLFDPAADGAQDWDLFLRATEKTQRIAHIPKVLYHWRMHASSTAHNDSAKNYAANAQLLAFTRHMERLNMNAKPEVMPDGLLHVRFERPPTAKVSIIIPTKAGSICWSVAFPRF